MKNFISKSFLPEQFEEDPEPKHHKHKYVPIDEVHDQADDSWKRYGEGLGTHGNTDIYVGELEDDRVSLENTEQKKSAFYFEGHYLDMDDPYDRAFYNAKKAESEDKEKYIDRETLHQDEISDFLDTHHKELEDTFEESDNKYNSW